MNFDLDEQQLLFRSTVERFVSANDVAGRRAARAMPGGFDPARWRELAEVGLLALPAPAAGGGLGGSLTDCAIVAKALGQGLAPEPWLECAVLPARLSGRASEGVTAVAIAERANRYELEPRRVTARRTGDRLLLSGEKIFVLRGEAADQLLVIARLDDRPILAALPANEPSVRRRGYTVIDGSRAAEIVFTDAPAELIDADLDRAFAETRVIAAAEMVGLAARLFDDTVAFVKTRRQFGEAIGRFQAIQHRLVDCYAMLEQMRSMLWRTVLGTLDPAAASGAKAFIGERALHIGHEAIQLHGGMGVTDELAIGHAHKRIVLLSKLFGDPAAELQRFALAA